MASPADAVAYAASGGWDQQTTMQVAYWLQTGQEPDGLTSQARQAINDIAPMGLSPTGVNQFVSYLQTGQAPADLSSVDESAQVLGTPPPAASATPSPATAPAAGLTDAQKSAKGIISSTLDQYGLGALADNAWQQFLSGLPIETVMDNVRTTPEWKARFGGSIDAFKKAHPDLRPPTEADVVNFENTANDVAHQYGIDTSFMNRAETDKLIAGGVSPVELTDRVRLASDATHAMDPETAQALQSMYGIVPGSGDATAFWLDPDKALPLLQRKFAAGALGGAAIRTGFGPVDAQTAEGLDAQGVTIQQAQAGFGALASEGELFTPLAANEDTISQKDQLAATFNNDAAAKLRIQRRAAGRVAALDGGGGYASGKTGVYGLGAVQE